MRSAARLFWSSRMLMKVFLIFFLAFCVSECHGLIHKLKISDDRREYFQIESFGFDTKGKMQISVFGFSLKGPVPGAAGFFIRKSQWDTTSVIEEAMLLEEPGSSKQSLPRKRRDCLLTHPPRAQPGDRIFTLNSSDAQSFEVEVRSGEEGFYHLFFVNCAKLSAVSFRARLALFNVDAQDSKSYLSVGEAELSSVYVLLAGAYILLLVYWINDMRSHRSTTMRIHVLMAVLLVLKLVSLVCHAIDYHYLNIDGHIGAWAVIYDIVTFVKGVMMFVVILLIGMGWSLMKPFLADHDKRIMLVVISLQVLDNIALIIVEDTAPGSAGWFAWKDIFRIIDLICCGAVMLPIIWSIRHLREAAGVDGQAAKNIDRLKRFRHFYILTMAYIYFTRIIVYLLDASLSYRWVWLGEFSSELVTLAYFGVTGYMFRPVADNPYLKVDEDALQQLEMKPTATSGDNNLTDVM